MAVVDSFAAETEEAESVVLPVVEHSLEVDPWKNVFPVTASFAVLEGVGFQ